MKTIVAGLDATDRDHDVLAFARSLPAERLVPAIAVPVAGVTPEDLEPGTQAIVDNSPAHALHTLAEDTDADLVIVGSTHTGRLGRVFPGSTGEKLLNGAPCPVAVVPRGYEPRPIAKVGVAYDGREESEAALELAETFGAEIELIGVASIDAWTGPAVIGGIGYELETLRDDVQRQVHETLDTAVATRPEATRTMLIGDPARELVARSEQLDLLVTGSRGYGPLRSVLLGGVSGRLIRDAHCPVIVVPRRAG
jgi:nucleotide-binding universal stress UspA family protein